VEVTRAILRPHDGAKEGTTWKTWNFSHRVSERSTIVFAGFLTDLHLGTVVMRDV
jgi:hypothetical protein